MFPTNHHLLRVFRLRVSLYASKTENPLWEVEIIACKRPRRCRFWAHLSPLTPQHHLKPPIRLSHMVYLMYQHQVSSDIDAYLKKKCMGVVECLMMFTLLFQRYRTGIFNRPLTTLQHRL